MKKILICAIYILTIISFLNITANANEIDKAIAKSNIKKDTISISIKDIKTGKVVYNLNSEKLVPPASTQKLLTIAAAIDTLGYRYSFNTYLYKSTNNDLYLKLGADPFLTSRDLDTLIAKAKQKKIYAPKNFYIDDFILDSNEWGEGWQWDDEINPLMPKFGSYNLDKNLLNIVVMPMAENTPAKIYTKKFYPVTFMNLVTTGQNNILEIKKTAVAMPDMYTISGHVTQPAILLVPINNLKRYFRLRLEEAISNNKIEYYGNIAQKKLPSKDVYLVAEISHPMSAAVNEILKNSNNMVAETVFKIAGGKYANNTGSINSAIEMFNIYCNKLNINNKDIKIVDGSGVSKNNLMSADFMTNFLLAITKTENFEAYKNAMATAGEGTLKDRMLYFNGNLRAKTGSLSDISAIAGYITSQKGSNYAFDIMINDAKSTNNDKKLLEEYIIRAIYTEF